MENLIKSHGFLLQQLIFTYILVTSASKRGGIRLTDESGVITSPGYPNHYPNSIAFIWLINTTMSKYVELTFLDFDVEPYKDCGVDFVKIRNKRPEKNGNFEDVPQIDLNSKDSSIEFQTKGPFCNVNKPPKIVTSSSNLMAIVFITDSSVAGRGFKATYRSLTKQACPGTCYNLSHARACGEIKTESHGTIMTPGFPLRYPTEGECLWLINVEAGKYIRLEFTTIDMEFNAKLCMDELYVWDGKEESSSILMRGCRLRPRVLYSSSNHMRIKFKSRGYHLKRGFKALYTTTTTKGCGGEFHLQNGTFASPHFNIEAGYTYPAYSDCLWVVTAPEGNVISFKFISFDVFAGSTGYCDEDYVQVFDGSNTRTKHLGKYCNIEKPNVVTSSGNSLSMRFVSNAKKHGKGFKIQYRRHSTACGSSLGMEDGRISSYRISSSSFLRESPHFRPDSARLNGAYAWCSQPQINNRAGEYIHVDLRVPTKLTGVATQGLIMTDTKQSYYITKYKILYSNNDGRYFKTYRDPSTKDSKYTPMIFSGNKDGTGIRRNYLKQPIVAKMFRIFPLGYMHGKKRTICTRLELYGCKFDFGDGSLVQSLDGHIFYEGTSTSPKTSHWIISTSSIYINSAVYMMPLYFKIDCDKATLTISDGRQNKSYCGSNQPPAYQVYSGNNQLWITLQKKSANLAGQGFGLEYFTENLGSGRIFRSSRGFVRGMRLRRTLEERVFNTTKSTWIVVLPSHRRVVAKFTRLRIGKYENGKCDEFVEIKEGPFGSSPSYGNFCRGMPTKAVVTKGNIMRVELHSKLNPERTRRAIVSPVVTFEMVYTSLQESEHPSSSMVGLMADESPQRTRPKSKGGTRGCHSGNSRIYAFVIALLITLKGILLPT